VCARACVNPPHPPPRILYINLKDSFSYRCHYNFDDGDQPVRVEDSVFKVGSKKTSDPSLCNVTPCGLVNIYMC
jgi:hypothetical protein